MDHKSFFFYPFSLANITVDLNQQRKSWWKLTVIISGSTWPFLPSSPDPVVKISVTANLAVVKEIFQANIESLSMRDRQESPWEYIFNFISIIHLQPFQCHFLANKSYFPSFTFKKKFRVDQPKIKKLSNPIFQMVSPWGIGLLKVSCVRPLGSIGPFLKPTFDQFLEVYFLLRDWITSIVLLFFENLLKHLNR